MIRQIIERIRAMAAIWPSTSPEYRTTDPGYTDIGDFTMYPSSTFTRANRVATLYGIIKLLTEAVIPLQRRVYKGMTMVENHPLNMLLDRPYSQYDSWLGYEYPIRAMLTQGNGYWIVRRNHQGVPIDLVPAVEGGAYYPDRGPRRYSLSSLAGGHPGDVGDYSWKDVVALHWHGFTGLSSPSPIAFAVSRQVSLMSATINLLETRVRRAGQGGPVIKHTTAEGKDLPTAKQARDMIEVLADAYAGNLKQGRMPVLPPGLEGGSVPGFSQADELAIEILRWSLEDMARVYSIAPSRLGQMSGGGAGVRTQDYQDQVSDLAHFASAPVSDRVDMAMTVSLLTEDEQTDGLVIKADKIPLSLGSPADIASLGVQLVGGGLYTPNEYRKKYAGLPPHKDGDKLSPPRGAAAPGKNKAQTDDQ